MHFTILVENYFFISVMIPLRLFLHKSFFLFSDTDLFYSREKAFLAKKWINFLY